MTHKITFLGLLATFLVLSIPFLAMAQWGPLCGWSGGAGMMGGWGGGWFGMIFMAAFWILVIIGLIYFIKWLATSSRSKESFPAGGGRALDILKERYARGEIDLEEFEEKKRALEA